MELLKFLLKILSELKHDKLYSKNVHLKAGGLGVILDDLVWESWRIPERGEKKLLELNHGQRTSVLTRPLGLGHPAHAECLSTFLVF